MNAHCAVSEMVIVLLPPGMSLVCRVEYEAQRDAQHACIHLHCQGVGRGDALNDARTHRSTSYPTHATPPRSLCKNSHNYDMACWCACDRRSGWEPRLEEQSIRVSGAEPVSSPSAPRSTPEALQSSSQRQCHSVCAQKNEAFGAGDGPWACLPGPSRVLFTPVLSCPTDLHRYVDTYVYVRT